MSTMKVADRRKGDFPVEWDISDTSPDGRKKVENARKTFEDTVAQGFLAYVMDPNTFRALGDPIKEFDEQAERLLLVPPMAGGC